MGRFDEEIQLLIVMENGDVIEGNKQELKKNLKNVIFHVDADAIVVYSDNYERFSNSPSFLKQLYVLIPEKSSSYQNLVHVQG